MTVSEEKTCPAQNGITGLSLGRYEGWKQTACWVAHAGSRLKQINGQKASSDMSALKPYWGKLTVRKCVQRMLACSVGEQSSPTEVKVRAS